jgi:RecB family endonuclease NucS
VRRQVRLLVARCEVLYTGRLTARLPEAVRLLMFKADGSFLVHDDAGGFRPLNWIRSVFRPEYYLSRRLVVTRCAVPLHGSPNGDFGRGHSSARFKADGSVLVHDDSRVFKLLNWNRLFFHPLQDLDIRSILICRVRTIAVFAL